MAQQLLDPPQVGPHVEQVRSEAVPQGVGMDVPAGPGEQRVLVELPRHAARGEASAAAVDEQSRAVGLQLAAPCKIRVQSDAGLPHQRHHPLLVSLSAHADRVGREIGEIQADQLGDAQPRAVKQLQRGSIPHSRRGERLGSLDQGEAVVHRDHVGQRDPPLGKHQPSGRTVGDVSHPHPVLVEGANAGLLARERRGRVGRVAGGEESAQIVAGGRVELRPALIEELSQLLEIGEVGPAGVRRGALDLREVCRERLHRRVHGRGFCRAQGTSARNTPPRPAATMA